jgi:poly-gamma-glutamate synthesis protein (capsule biosynthesis protein)
MSFASNHALDYGDEALFDTLDVMRENNVSVIGAGKNIREARQPAIFERKGTTIGFLAYCSVVPRGFQAEADKSGVAPLRATTAYEPIDWQAGMPPKVVTRTFPDDLAAMKVDISKLRRQVDIVVVSMHWGVHFIPAVIADYQYEAGHAAIDAGADLIIGTHAHILKGIEVYKGKVIFFSLCNFNMDLPLAGPVAEEMAASQQRPAITAVKIDENNRTDVGFHCWEVDPDYPTYGFPIDSHKTMLVKCTITHKKIQRVAFLPLYMNKKGQPEPLAQSDPRNEEVFNYMQWLCRDQELDTRLIRDGDEIVVVAGNEYIEKNH